MGIIRKKHSLYMLLLVVVLASLLFVSCEKEEKEPPKSMEQYQEEDGITIEVKNVEKQEFKKKMSLFAKLSGIKESTQHSMVADKVLKVNGRIGTRVSAGKIVMKFPTDNPAVQYTQAKTALNNAEKTYNRMKELVKAGETAQQNFDNVETQYLVNKRQFEAVKQMLFVEAPISGTIIQLFVKEGDDVGMGKPLFTVAQTSVMKATAWASEEEIGFIKMGMPCTIEFGGKEYSGKISEVGLAMDNQKRAFKIEAQFKNRKNELKSGVSTDLNIVTYENKDIVVVPRHLIMSEGEKKFVFVENGGSAHKKYIKTGQESGIDVEVLEGLAVSDKLIVKGQALVSDGTKVQVNK